MYSAALLVPLLAGAVQAHMNPYHPSMYGVGDYFSYDLGDPFAPLGPGWQLDDWWFRGAATRALGPAQRSVTKGVLDLPAGGTISLEIACHVAWTSYGCCTTEPGSYTDACPYNTGAYHSGDPDSDQVDDSLLSGCALAIADKDHIEKVGWDDLTIFTVQHDCVKQKVTSFDIPAKMPPCTGDKCICGWFWLANNGTANFYMTAFDCKVSGSPPDARPIAPPQDPLFCQYEPEKCVTGAKRPLYAYNYPSNIPWADNNHRPGYHASWSFPNNGAQNDIFVATLPASSANTSSAVAASSASSGLSTAASSVSGARLSSSAVSSSTLASPSPSASGASSASSSSVKISASSSGTTGLASSSASSLSSSSAQGSGATSSARTATAAPPAEVSSSTSSSTASSSAAPVASSAAAIAKNLALQATASASSSWPQQPPTGAINGVIGGLDGYGGGALLDEWSAYFGKVGTWYQLTWPNAVILNQIVLWDRPNIEDNVMAGNITFDDGSGVSFGRLDDRARLGTYLNLSHSVTTKTLRILVNQISPTTNSVGLSEVQVFLRDSSELPSSGLVSPSAALAASAAAVTTTSSVNRTANTSSDTSKAATTSLSSAAQSSKAAASSATSSAAPASQTPVLSNLALNAKASASSSWPQQPPSGANNGVIGGLDGYGGGALLDEWSAYFGKVGTWYQLTWPSAVNFNQIVLWDRPNIEDNIMSGNITFDDGSGVSFGRLDDRARLGTYLNLSRSITTKSLRILVNQVSPTTNSVGLSEVQVFNAYASQFPSDTKVTPTMPVGGKRMRARHARDFTAAEEDGPPLPTSPVPEVVDGKDNSTLAEEVQEIGEAALLAPAGLVADNLFNDHVPELADVLQDA
ncbi:hypothetical protein JCM11251_000639 [Rhodosporidiobolus azoricus]